MTRIQQSHDRRPGDRSLPLPVWVFGFALFAQGTSELILAGLIPTIATDLGTTIPQAGQLVSAFALGVFVGSPSLAILTLRWPRRSTLLAFLALFVLTHVACALSDSHDVLLVARFAGGFAYAGFSVVASSAAMALAGPSKRGRAMSVILGGLSTAMIVGLPGGVWIGVELGWRWAFWAIVALSLASAVMIFVLVPPLRLDLGTTPLRHELAGLVGGRLWISYALTAIATAASIGTFSYLGAMLIDGTGLDQSDIPLVLCGYGIGALIGISVGGRSADRWPRLVLGAGLTGLVIVLALFALLLDHTASAIVLSILLGLIGFGTNPILASRYVPLAPAAPTLAVAGNVSAFNVGIALGPWLTGLALASDLGYSAVPAVSAVIAATALLVWLGDLVLERSHP